MCYNKIKNRSHLNEDDGNKKKHHRSTDDYNDWLTEYLARDLVDSSLPDKNSKSELISTNL